MTKPHFSSKPPAGVRERSPSNSLRASSAQHQGSETASNIQLITGGARSGKSSAAVRLAAATGVPVTMLATATAGDAEMEARIARHQAERDKEWTTVEEPVQIDRALSTIDNEHTVIIDCLALWVTNQLSTSDDNILLRVDDTIRLLRSRQGVSLIVTNEVGSGIVPVNEIARRFRDLLGLVNQRFSSVADRTLLCVAGGVVPVVKLEDL
ncbi:MAG: bifunctional adenosylcobinamide kinase/adenosylcobinamide-phosphate guanylyltransferase [Acidimicrobiaceae bacterium]|nr:bifunctional adenosylcobinamide kinase/adenosylcobinamide-phosphate guanylyltransferase [Acidimicrobiaceae bacterium]HBU75708.1 bifunctional adenosylcobinamide kinase/adenosylcobinamide-phosphate guanylyltransferase [Acidimicrobiaceae bacterium]